jgi:hypothetical protein
MGSCDCFARSLRTCSEAPLIALALNPPYTFGNFVVNEVDKIPKNGIECSIIPQWRTLMPFHNKLGLDSAEHPLNRVLHFALTIFVAAITCSAVTQAQGDKPGQAQTGRQTVEREREREEQNRPVQITINAPAERVRALIIADAAQKDSNTIEDAGEYKIVIKRPSDEGDYGHTTGQYISTTIMTTFVIAEVEKGKTFVRLDVALVISGTSSGPHSFDTGKSKQQRTRSEKILQELKERSEQSDQSAKPPIQP